MLTGWKRGYLELFVVQAAANKAVAAAAAYLARKAAYDDMSAGAVEMAGELGLFKVVQSGDDNGRWSFVGVG